MQRETPDVQRRVVDLESDRPARRTVCEVVHFPRKRGELLGARIRVDGDVGGQQEVPPRRLLTREGRHPVSALSDPGLQSSDVQRRREERAVARPVQVIGRLPRDARDDGAYLSVAADVKIDESPLGDAHDALAERWVREGGAAERVVGRGFRRGETVVGALCSRRGEGRTRFSHRSSESHRHVRRSDVVDKL